MAPRVLLVEDEHTLREALAEVLRGEGYDVLPVATGQAALEAFTGAPESFQCAVLDCLIPKPDGLEVAARIRGTRPDLPLIMMSGIYKSPSQQNDARERLGVRAFLVKPFDVKRFVEVVRAAAPTTPSAGAKS